MSTLQVADQNPSTFGGKLVIIVPPLVLTLGLEANTMDPAHLIRVLSIVNFKILIALALK